MRNIASQIGGQQKNMRQFHIMLLVPHPRIGPLYEEIWSTGYFHNNGYASQIGGKQQNMRQFQIMSLVPHSQIGYFMKESGQLADKHRTDI